MFVLFILNAIFSDVSVNMNAPGQVEAGNEILIEISLDKSDFDSFARFQQEIPGGLTPIPVKTANADFSFKDQKVKFIWLKLPSDERITIYYKLRVDQRLKGTFNLGGTFSYIANNERKSVEVDSKLVAINPSPNVDPKLIVDVNDFKTLVTPVQKTVSGVDQVKCIRQVPYLADEGNQYQVNLLVNKGNKEKFAKIQETIPEGYSAVALESKDAIFTFKDQTVKLLWMNLPSDPYFVISYRLVPNEGIKDAPILDGTFSYIEEDNTLSIDIIEKDINLQNVSDENLLAIVSTSEQNIAAPVDYVQPQDYTGKVKIEIAESALKLIREDTKLTHMLEPESGIYYRVQIAAGHRPININRYFKKYNLDKEVRTEFHEGWRKYSVGSFYVYKAARDYRVHIWNTTTIDDAFVSAYNEGKRITVQEALMVSNHEWYR
ncbi:MAG: hypothetical protein C0597_11290 [Marinilabiliales bacterium]|nr:MAG: hypothetical protein C0597_11290 [Marinilabiliales bacterium]